MGTRLIRYWVRLALFGAMTMNAFGQTRVLMLGTGTPNADPDRSGPAVAILVNGSAYLVDAGPGVVRRAAAAEKKGVAGIKVESLTHVFITHLHSDHTLGLPDLMYTPWILEREKALRITGPKGIKRMVNAIAAAWADDLELRTHSAEPVHKSGYKPVISEFGGDGVVYRDKNVTVAAFRVPHTAWKEAYGYIFQAADRKIVISGDCTPNDAIVRACNECDVLVHEVYSAEKLRTRPPEWQVYHRQAHTSTVDLARIASEAKPKLLLLYHQLYWGATDEDLVKEVKRGYNGEVKSARDLEVY